MGIHLTQNDIVEKTLPKIVAEDFVESLLKVGARHGKNDLSLVQGAHDHIAKLVDCVHCGPEDLKKDEVVDKYNENHDDAGRFASGSGGGGSRGEDQSPNEGPNMGEASDEDADWEAYADAAYGNSRNRRKAVGKRGARHSKTDLEKIKQAHDIMCSLGAKCAM